MGFQGCPAALSPALHFLRVVQAVSPGLDQAVDISYFYTGLTPAKSCRAERKL